MPIKNIFNITSSEFNKYMKLHKLGKRRPFKFKKERHRQSNLRLTQYANANARAQRSLLNTIWN